MPLQKILPGDHHALQEIGDLLVESHRVVVITGAGISTSCGIPDFRSKRGLCSLIADKALPPPPSSTPSTPSDSTLPLSRASNFSRQSLPASRMRGQDLFDASVWKDPSATIMFYKFIASLRQKIKRLVNTSWSHKFIRALREGGRLMRCYT